MRTTFLPAGTDTRRTALMALSLIAIMLLTACNTFRGVGQDVEAGGRGIGSAADATSEAIDEAVD